MINSGGNDNKDLLNNEYEDNNILNQSIQVGKYLTIIKIIMKVKEKKKY